MRRKNHVVKLLNGIGVFLMFSGGFLILLSRKNASYLDIGCITLFIGIMLLIPDSYLFLIKQLSKGDGMGIYWFVKFLTLPLVLVLLLIYFFVRFNR
jgi:hypothetical protein